MEPTGVREVIIEVNGQWSLSNTGVYSYDQLTYRTHPKHKQNCSVRSVLDSYIYNTHFHLKSKSGIFLGN